MGRRGPPPKPSEQKRREGTYRPDRSASQEPTVTIGEPPMPLAVKNDPDARKCWQELAPRLIEMRTLSTSDGVTFSGLCCAYSLAIRAQRATKRGVLIKSRLGALIPNPAVKMAKDGWAEVRQYAAHFGLSPSSRSRVNVPQQPDEKDQAEDFLFGDGARVVGRIGA